MDPTGEFVDIDSIASDPLICYAIAHYCKRDDEAEAYLYQYRRMSRELNYAATKSAAAASNPGESNERVVAPEEEKEGGDGATATEDQVATDPADPCPFCNSVTATDDLAD